MTICVSSSQCQGGLWLVFIFLVNIIINIHKGRAYDLFTWSAAVSIDIRVAPVNNDAHLVLASDHTNR